MAVRIEDVRLLNNPALVGEQVKIEVVIVHHKHLASYTHLQLKPYTHGELRERGSK